MPRLTKRLVDAATASSQSDQFIWDDGLAGFGVRVKPSGTKSFVLQYRNAAGRSRRITLAKFGVLTVEQAREEARLRLADVVRGIDPAEVRQAARAAMTVKELCEEYLARAQSGHIITRRGRPKKDSTLQLDRGRVERHIIPLIGHRSAADVTRSDVRNLLRDISSGKTAADVRTKARGRAIIKGGRGAASRTLGLLGGIFSFAVDEGIRSDNPVRGITRPADNRREFRLDRAGYARLGSRLRAAERAGLRWQITDAIRLLALTGCRRGEIIQLRRAEVDLESNALRLGDTKTGKSVRPLGRSAAELLRTIMSRTSGEFIFPAVRGSGPYGGLPKAWSSVLGRRIPGLTPHGLRHSFASVAEDLGCSLPTIAALLGHAGHSVTAGYIHKIDSALVSAASDVSDEIQRLLGSKFTA